MIKTLLKKQISEIFRSYLYNPKTGKARSSAATAGYIIIFVLLIVGLIGGMFTGLSLVMAGALSSVGLDWLYFAIMGLIALLLGSFGSVFNTYSGLYLSKDNDLLLSCPIPVSSIIASRLLGVYIMGLIYSATVTVPAAAVYILLVKCSAGSIIGGLIFILMISVSVMTLSCILGYAVAKISLKLKNKSFVTVLSSLLFIGLYYLLYFKAQSLIQDLISNAVVYGEKIKTAAYPIYIFGKAPTGDALACIGLSAVVLAFFAITVYIISRSFLKIATSTAKAGNKTYKEQSSKSKSAGNALFFKELRRFTSSSGYMLNCGFGILFLLFAGVALLFKGEEIFQNILPMFGLSTDFSAAILTFIICLMSTMNNMAAPSVSLEGKSIWLLQSLPISPYKAIKSKLLVQIVLTSPPTLFCSLCAAFTSSFSIVQKAFIILFPQLFVLLFAAFAMFMGLKMPNLSWTSEIIVIKQSGCVGFSLLFGFAYPILLGLAYFLLGNTVGFIPFILIVTLVTAALTLLLDRWIRKTGSETFANL